MTASLNVQFADAPTPGDPDQDVVRSAVAAAFSEWTRHFDYTAGVFTINVSFRAGVQPADVSMDMQAFTRVGVASPLDVVEPTFGLGFAARAASSTILPKPTLYINPAKFNGAAAGSSIVAPIERELGHALGISRLRTGSLLTSILSNPLLRTRETVYDTGVRNVQGAPNFITTFNGPNAEAAYGGPVPVDAGNTDITTVGRGLAVDTTTQGASTVQPLDVALLRDAGLPALSDQELGEHQVARLYVAAFGRNADSAGLVQQYGGLRAGRTLAQLGDGIVGSAEFANRYGGLSNADFVNALYQNVLGRPGDASGVASFNGALASGASRGTILAAFADSDEERGRLNGNPNVTYAATAEAQVARMYDTAFGRDADPVGFSQFVGSVIGGTTPQQVALSFLGSSEFGSRYGAAPSDQALVDALYQNTLHRAPDAAGEAQYVRALASGQFSRADLLVAFSDSQEHIDLVAQRTGARDAAGFNLDLLPHLGVIPVIGGPVTA